MILCVDVVFTYPAWFSSDYENFWSTTPCFVPLLAECPSGKWLTMISLLSRLCHAGVMAADWKKKNRCFQKP